MPFLLRLRWFSHDVTAAKLVNKKMKWRSCYCMWGLNSFLMQKISFVGFNSITLIELHIHFKLRISDYAVIQKYLECCNANFRAENFRFPDSELHNIFFLENLDFHLVIRQRYHKLTRHSLEVLFRV